MIDQELQMNGLSYGEELLGGLECATGPTVNQSCPTCSLTLEVGAAKDLDALR